MVLILSGTGDGRKITRALIQKSYPVSVIASTSYGRELAVEDGAALVGDGLPADVDTLIKDLGIRVVVDARHPFNRQNEESLIKMCSEQNIIYLRVGREETSIASSELVHQVHSMAEAAEKVVTLGKTIFLTTGSNDLEHFINLQKKHDIRLVVRVLPEHKVIKKCQDLGIKPRDIVAMQGPFSKQINKALFKMYRASVVVTKDSGKAGGTDTKVDAALSLKIPVVIVKRLHNLHNREYGWQEVLELLLNKLPLQKDGRDRYEQ